MSFRFFQRVLRNPTTTFGETFSFIADMFTFRKHEMVMIDFIRNSYIDLDVLLGVMSTDWKKYCTTSCVGSSVTTSMFSFLRSCSRYLKYFDFLKNSMYSSFGWLKARNFKFIVLAVTIALLFFAVYIIYKKNYAFSRVVFLFFSDQNCQLFLFKNKWQQ